MFSNKLFLFSFKILNAIFFQSCFMSETQVLITVSNFFFLGIIFGRLEGGFTFQWEGTSFLSGRAPHGGDINFDWGFKKN